MFSPVSPPNPGASPPYRYERRTFAPLPACCSARRYFADRSPRRSMLRAPWPSARIAAVCFAAVLGLTLSACDDAPGVTDPFAAPPTLSDFSFTPLEFALDTDAPTAEIPLTLSAQVANPGGRPIDVRYFVRSEFGNESLADGELTPAGGGRYEGGATLSIPRGETGAYVVTVTVLGEDGLVGNTVTGLLRFTAQSLGPPVIEAVDFPETVQRPADGQPAVLIPIVATVSDPDGQRNVNRVLIRTEGGAEFELRDDGAAGSGDETAGDGRYTITFQAESTNEPGPNLFTIQAFDRAGGASDPFSLTITIE